MHIFLGVPRHHVTRSPVPPRQARVRGSSCFRGPRFVRRTGICYALSQAAASDHASLRVTPTLQADLHFWITYADQFNGQALILYDCALHPLYFCTDASLEGPGIGNFFDHHDDHHDGEYFHARFSNLRKHALPAHCLHRDLWPRAHAVPITIGYFELFALWWALVTWGPRLPGFHWHITVQLSR